jgi:hypothetical protein
MLRHRPHLLVPLAVVLAGGLTASITAGATATSTALGPGDSLSVTCRGNLQVLSQSDTAANLACTGPSSPGIPAAPPDAYSSAVGALTGVSRFARLDERAGTVAYDSGPAHVNGLYASTGVTYGAVDALAATGIPEGAVQLAPGTGSVVFASDASFNLSTSSSSKWLLVLDVRTDATWGYPQLISKGDPTANGFALFYDAVNSALGFIIDGQQYAEPGVSLTTMSNVAVNFDGTNLRFFVNGSQVMQTGTSTQKVTDSGPLTVGASGGLTVAKLVVATNDNTAAIPGLYSALTGPAGAATGVTANVATPPTTAATQPRIVPAPTTSAQTPTTSAPTPTTSATSQIPAAPAMGWPSRFGTGRVVMADDFNGPTLSKLWGSGLYGQGCGLSDHGTKQAEYPDADPGAVALYTPANVLMGDSNNQPGGVILRARYQSQTISAPACGLTTNYTSGAINTFPAGYPSGAGSGDGYAPAGGGFLWRSGQTDLIIQYMGTMPGTHGAGYLWYGGWAYSTPTWNFEQDLNESVADSGSGAGDVRVPMSTTHYSNTPGGSAGDAQYSQGPWGTPTSPAPGTKHVYSAWLHANGALDMYMDGRLVTSNPPANTQNKWMGFAVQYGIDNPPRSFYPNWTGDQLSLDYVVAWQPRSLPAGTGIYHGGVAAGTTLP